VATEKKKTGKVKVTHGEVVRHQATRTTVVTGLDVQEAADKGPRETTWVADARG